MSLRFIVNFIGKRVMSLVSPGVKAKVGKPLLLDCRSCGDLLALLVILKEL